MVKPDGAKLKGEVRKGMKMLSRNKKRWGALALAVGAGLLFATGCSARDAGGDTGGAEEEGGGTVVERFAVVTPALESDYGWNQAGIVGAQEAAEELGIELDENTDVGYDNGETILTQVAENDNQFVIAHANGFNTDGHRVGVQTGIPVLVNNTDQNTPGTVATVQIESAGGGYLAGVVAAMQTETDTVGIVASAEDVNWMGMSGGFAQGAYSVNPDIEIVFASIGPAEYGDSAGGTAVANQVIAAGADVIFGMGDGATVGYLQAIETSDRDVKYIGTVGDVTPILEDEATLLTSVMWNFKHAYVEAIQDIENGTYGTKTYVLNVENDGLSLLDTSQLTDEMKTAVEEAVASIADGSADLEVTTDIAGVQSVISGG